MQLFEVYGCKVRPLLKAVEDRDDCCSGDSGGDEGRDEAGGEGGEGRHAREQAEVPGEVQAQYTTQVQHLGTYTASQFQKIYHTYTYHVKANVYIGQLTYFLASQNDAGK